MKVRAKQLGFYKGRRREGDVFEVPEGWKAKWTEPVSVPAKAKAEAEEPETLGQVQRRNSKKDRKAEESKPAEE